LFFGTIFFGTIPAQNLKDQCNHVKWIKLQYVPMYLRITNFYDFAHKNNSIYILQGSFCYIPKWPSLKHSSGMYFFIRNEKPNQEKQNSPSKLNYLNVDSGFRKEKESPNVKNEATVKSDSMPEVPLLTQP